MVPLIGALFNDAISSTYRTVSNGSPIWMDVQGRGRDVTEGAVLVFAWRHDENSQGSRYTGQDTKPRPPEHKSNQPASSALCSEKNGGKAKEIGLSLSICDGASFGE